MLSLINRIVRIENHEFLKGFWGVILRSSTNHIHIHKIKTKNLQKFFTFFKTLVNKIIIPSKVHIEADMYSYISDGKDRLGKAISILSKDRRKLLYRNWASITQYAFQPFSRLMLDIEVIRINEPNVKLGSTSVPFGDGQLYASPDSIIWYLADLHLKHSIEGMKVIGKSSYNDFIFLKGVVIRLSKKEWLRKCQEYGIDPSFNGIVANQHSIKDKLKFISENQRLFKFVIGYHSDDRRFHHKQTISSQAVLRSTNYKKSLYFNKIKDKLEAMRKASQSKDWKGLFEAAKGKLDIIANRLAAGLPPAFMSMIPNRPNKVVETLIHMLFKNFGKLKVQFSTSTYPSCRLYLKNGRALGMSEVGLSPNLARELKAKIGSEIVLIRSPKSAGYPALVLTVVSTKETGLVIHPTLYTIMNQGDFDGDTVILYLNHHDIIDFIKVPDSQLMSIIEEEYGDAYSSIIAQEWETSDNRKIIEELPEILKGLAQAMIAKRETGMYDTIASSLSKSSSNSQLRVIWNNITQVTITNMKHVGSPIPDGLKIYKALKCSKLESYRKLLTGDTETYEAKGASTSYLDIKRFIVDSSSTEELPSIKKARAEFESMVQRPEFSSIRRTLIGNALYKRTNQAYKLVNLNPQLSSILNDPVTNTTEKFNLIYDYLNSAFNYDSEIALAYRMIYSIAFFEPVKRWIITRPLPESLKDFEFIILDLIRTIQ